jgi:O-antigen/teichoic acid export membrane protein
MSVLNLRLDVVMLGALGGAVATGQYALGVQFTELLWIVPTAIGYVLFPQVAAAPEDDGLRTASLCRKAMVLGLAVGFAALMAALLFVAVVAAYRPAIVAILILLPGTIAFTAAKVVGNDLYGRGLPHAHMWAAGVSVLFTVIGDVALIPRFGFVAAAAVSSISYTLYAVVILWWFQHVTGIAPWTAVVPTASDIRGLVGVLLAHGRSRAASEGPISSDSEDSAVQR